MEVPDPQICYRALQSRRPASALRREGSTASAPAGAGVTLRLRYRPPYEWESMLAYLRARAIPGIEVIEDESYLRTVEIDGFVGSVRVVHLPRQQSLGATIRSGPRKSTNCGALCPVEGRMNYRCVIASALARTTADLPAACS